ncbi:hypothetical protein AHiyo8_25580 [Arthrobacter sp. Hiyo8]|nr:hypothetical protein AHiyo8_25580 [Arthrobacter sp. Hiyo8]
MDRGLDAELGLGEIQPDFHPDIPGAESGDRVLVRHIVAREKDPRSRGCMAQELDRLALGGMHHRGLEDTFAVLEEHSRATFKDRARSGDGVLRYVIVGSARMEYDAGRLVFEDRPRSFLRDSGQDLADFGKELPLGVVQLEFRRTGPIQASAPWLPISSVASGGEATARRLASARPEMSAVVVLGSLASSAKAVAERWSGRAASAWSTIGEMVPSKSIATKRWSVRAILRTASSSSGVRLSGEWLLSQESSRTTVSARAERNSADQ